MSTVNDRIDPEQLIGLVAARPGLWDKSLERHKALDQRSASWRDICKILCSDYDNLTRKDKHIYAKTVIKKWTNIRDAWRKSRQQDSKSKRKQKPYIYHAKLKFLEKNLQPRKKNVDEDSMEHNLTKQLDKSEMYSEDTGDKVDKISLDDSDDLASDSMQYSTADNDDECSTSRGVVTKRTIQDLQESEIQFMDMKSLGNQSEENPHLCFIRGLLPMLNKLSEDETLEFQLGVIHLLQDLRNKTKNITHEPIPYYGIASSSIDLNTIKEDLDNI